MKERAKKAGLGGQNRIVRIEGGAEREKEGEVETKMERERREMREIVENRKRLSKE